MRKMGVGVIGCGVISKAYMTAMQRFSTIELKAVADMRSATAEARGAEFGVPAMRVDEMLKRDDIEIIVNLTVPLAHTDVSLAALNAGKHVHSEKPIGVNIAEARKVIDLAAAKGLRVGSAPDTFLGGSHQTARKLIDDGAIGAPVGGSVFFGCPGHERWHPAPGFYYLRGGGPMPASSNASIRSSVSDRLLRLAPAGGLGILDRRWRGVIGRQRRQLLRGDCELEVVDVGEALINADAHQMVAHRQGCDRYLHVLPDVPRAGLRNCHVLDRCAVDRQPEARIGRVVGPGVGSDPIVAGLLDIDRPLQPLAGGPPSRSCGQLRGCSLDVHVVGAILAAFVPYGGVVIGHPFAA